MPENASRADRQTRHEVQFLIPTTRGATRRNRKSRESGSGTAHFQNRETRKRGAGNMESKSARIYIRVAPHERDLLRKKAKRARLSVSEYVRSSAVYGDQPVTVIDIKPLVRLNWELTKHGANLNQMVKFLNTYGERACDADEVARVLDRETDALDKVGEALISLRQEAEAHHVIINLDAPEYDEDEER